MQRGNRTVALREITEKARMPIRVYHKLYGLIRMHDDFELVRSMMGIRKSGVNEDILKLLVDEWALMEQGPLEGLVPP